MQLGVLREIWESTIAALNWIPDRVIALIVLLLAVVLAIIVHALLVRLARRAVADRHPFFHSLLKQAKGPSRFALVLLALTIAAHHALFNTGTGQEFAHLLQVAFIVLVGWMVLAAVGIGADWYLQRFRLDVEDNLLARKHITQIRVLKGVLNTLIVLLTAGAALMSFPDVRQFGISLFASAGIAGIVAGFAARPVLSNLMAGVQLAMTQPIRLDDAVVVEGEFGRVEEITSTYVVLRLWDWRRMIVPLSYFIEKPFQNWTREGSRIIGAVSIYTDYSVNVHRVREKLAEIVKESKLWDGGIVNLQVIDAKETAIELRALVSAQNSDKAGDLRAEVREKLIAFLQREYPQSLPRRRQEVVPSLSAVEQPNGDPQSGQTHTG